VKLLDVMEEVAVKLRAAPSLTGRTTAFIPGAIVAPAAMIGFPTDGTFDATYGRGRDSMTLPVIVAIGRPTDASTAKRLAGYIDGSGPESVKALLDGDDDDYVSCDGVRVTGWETDVYPFGGVDHLVCVFPLEIYGPGEG